jgi:hypothetical protein
MALLLRRRLRLSETLHPDYGVLPAQDGNGFIWERKSGKAIRRFPELLWKIRLFDSITTKKI